MPLRHIVRIIKNALGLYNPRSVEDEEGARGIRPLQFSANHILINIFQQ